MADLTRLFLLIVIPLGLVSCGKDSKSAETAGPVAKSGFQQKSGEMFDDDSDKILGRYGANNPLYSKGQGGGSATEGSDRKNSEFAGNYAGKEFATNDYEKKSFWGKKDYVKQVYGGDTDGSRFMRESRVSGEQFREAGKASREAAQNYDAGTYGTGSAREGSQKGIDRVSDGETDVRRAVYQQPKVEDWRAKRALSRDDTRRMLGE